MAGNVMPEILPDTLSLGDIRFAGRFSKVWEQICPRIEENTGREKNLIDSEKQKAGAEI
jgi:hypothetical protein